MRIQEVEVLLIYVSIFMSGTSFSLAGDIPQKELTIRSIDANSKSNSEQPLRVNLTCKFNPIKSNNKYYHFKKCLFISLFLLERERVCECGVRKFIFSVINLIFLKIKGRKRLQKIKCGAM